MTRDFEAGPAITILFFGVTRWDTPERRSFERQGNSMSEDLKAEHERLMEQTKRLQQEHDILSKEPVVDRQAHEEHKKRLREKIRELRAHMDRLERENPAEKS